MRNKRTIGKIIVFVIALCLILIICAFVVSRRKFAQLTKVFTRSKKRGGRQLLPPTASCDDLLDPEESSRPQS